MSSADLERIKTWFTGYAHTFLTGAEPADSGIRMKITHTLAVAAVIRELADSLGLGPEDRRLAEIIALLHDIGRFKQFSRYGTYADHASADHAALGVAVIEEHDLLRGFAVAQRAIIRNAVRHHNRAAVPALEGRRALFFLKLLRDADKIDVLRVVTDHYRGIHTNAAIGNGLPNTPEISESIINNVANRQLARLADAKTLNDFKLLQIGYVFDLNFPRSYTIVRQRRYVEIIGGTLPQTDAVRRAVSAARQWLERSEASCKTP